MAENDDPPLIRFGACVCGSPADWPARFQPPWAKVSGFDNCVRLLDDDGSARSTAPIIGEVVSLDVGFPFEQRGGEPFWCVYMPPLAAANGLADAPAEIVETRMVRCSVKAINRQPDRSLSGRAGGVVRCRAVVVDVLTLQDLFALPVEAGQGRPFGAYPNVQHSGGSGWRFIASDFESDVADWGIWREVSGVGHVVMQGFFDHHADFVYAGHRLLTLAERNSFDSVVSSHADVAPRRHDRRHRWCSGAGDRPRTRD